jgi:hypothetical protein
MPYKVVMVGLVPTIHVFSARHSLGTTKEVVDGRDKRDHDDGVKFVSLRIQKHTKTAWHRGFSRDRPDLNRTAVAQGRP